MIYEILNEDGAVENRIVADEQFMASTYPGHYREAVDQPASEPVPQSVEMWRARRALLDAGKLALVQPAIDAMPEPQKSEANIMWNYATAVARADDFTLAIGAAIGLDSAGMDQLFVAAAQL